MRYRQWPEICKIPDPLLRMALALLDLHTDYGQSVAARFEECFSPEEQSGPIPLSVLRQAALMKAAREGYICEEESLVSDGACERYHIPIITLMCDASSYRDGLDWLPLPEELSMLRSIEGVGQLVEWQGKDLVVVENGLPTYVALAPSECIALDC